MWYLSTMKYRQYFIYVIYSIYLIIFLSVCHQSVQCLLRVSGSSLRVKITMHRQYHFYGRFIIYLFKLSFRLIVFFYSCCWFVCPPLWLYSCVSSTMVCVIWAENFHLFYWFSVFCLFLLVRFDVDYFDIFVVFR